MFRKVISFVKDLRNRSFSGQAVAEYWPTVPAAVMLGLLAGQFLTGALVPLYEAIVESVYAAQENNIQPVDVEEEGGLVCEETVTTTAPASIELSGGGYTIDNTSFTYQDGNTHVTYVVTSTASPAISHWMLLKPECLTYDDVLAVYETEGTNLKDVTNAMVTGVDGSAEKVDLFWDGWKMDDGWDDGETRILTFVFKGELAQGDIETTVKAGKDVYVSGMIVGVGCPVSECEPSGEESPAEEPPAEEPPAEEPPAEEEVWDKSSVAVSDASCNSNAGKVEFTVRNTGTEPMDGTTDWRLYENGAQIDSGTLQLGGTESTTLKFSVTKKTTSKFRLEVDQRPGHPGSSVPQADVECK